MSSPRVGNPRVGVSASWRIRELAYPRVVQLPIPLEEKPWLLMIQAVRLVAGGGAAERHYGPYWTTLGGRHSLMTLQMWDILQCLSRIINNVEG